MLEQVLKQTASKTEAKSNQSQRQIVASHLLVLGMHVETSSIASLSNARAEPAPSVAPSPPTPVDGMDGLTIHLTDLPSLDGEVPCEVEPWSPEHPADLIIRVCCLPVAICRVGYDAAMESPLGLCRCERCGTHFRDGRTAMRIVQVLR